MRWLIALLMMVCASPTPGAARYCEITKICQGTCLDLSARLIVETDPNTAPSALAPIMDSILVIADARLMSGDPVPPRIAKILMAEYGTLPDNAVVLTHGTIGVPPNGQGLFGALHDGGQRLRVTYYDEAPDGRLELVSGAGLLQRTATGTCGDRT